MRLLYNNKKAYHDFDIKKEYEAGIVLEGWEVKSMKAMKVSLKGSYIKPDGNELYLVGATVKKWDSGYDKSLQEQARERKLLLHKNQIKQIENSSKQSGFTVVPLELYTNDRGKIKLRIGIGKGMKKYDKRAKLKHKDMKRRIDEERKNYNY